jgi:uncharacterized protein (DUF1330 family)
MPKAYVIAHMNLINADKYKENYGLKVSDIVRQYGGKYLIRGGEITQIEGTTLGSRIAVIEFADKASALAWYNSPEYQSIIDGRINNSESILNIVEGV